MEIFNDETGLYRSVLSNTEIVEIWLKDEPNLADPDGIESNNLLPIESKGISSNIVLKTKLVVSRLVKVRRDSSSGKMKEFYLSVRRKYLHQKPCGEPATFVLFSTLVIFPVMFALWFIER